MIRSFFFAPGNRRDLIDKLPRSAADCYVIDLEDGTPPSEKVAARMATPDSLASLRQAGVVGQIAVRVNDPDSRFFEDDIQALASCDLDAIVIPKLEHAAQLESVLEILRSNIKDAEKDNKKGIIGGIESVRGVLNAVELAEACPEMKALYFGATDIITEIGGQRSVTGLESLYARSRVLLACKAAKIDAIDQGIGAFRDEERFRVDCRAGRAMGYTGKICIHPRQVELANEEFAPTPEEIDYAERLIAAFKKVEASGRGTMDFEGRMVDGPILKQAYDVLAYRQRAQSNRS